MRLDAVITWVNGSDPLWRNKRKEFVSTDASSTGNAEQRYRDNGELFYLLRSLEKYWPFDGQIILVTDNQIPDFIDPSSGIRIVDHRDILEEEYLPTFSSMAILSALHKIPNLSERFVVFSDDMFLTREVKVEDFFGLRGARTYLFDQPTPETVDEESTRDHHSACLARDLIRKTLGGKGLGYMIAPHPQGITKSHMERLERNYPEVFHAVRSERFISEDNQSIIPYLYYEYGYAVGLADVIKDDTLFLSGYDISNEYMKDEVRKAIDSKFCVCIQDTLRRKRDVEDFRMDLKSLMSDLFTEPSRWELKD